MSTDKLKTAKKHKGSFDVEEAKEGDSKMQRLKEKYQNKQKKELDMKQQITKESEKGRTKFKQSENALSIASRRLSKASIEVKKEQVEPRLSFDVHSSQLFTN